MGCEAMPVGGHERRVVRRCAADPRSRPPFTLSEYASRVQADLAHEHGRMDTGGHRAKRICRRDFLRPPRFFGLGGPVVRVDVGCVWSWACDVYGRAG